MAVGSFYRAVVILTLGFELTSSAPEDRRKGVPEVGSKASRGVFAPRMYYDEWTPLGHGDPLKHDPTYDYVPPVLDQVHYWEETSSVNARKDYLLDLEAKQQQQQQQQQPDGDGFPATMLVPPPLPLPSIELASSSTRRPAPTTLVDVQPINMVLHSSTTGSLADLRTPKPAAAAAAAADIPLAWRAPNTPAVQLTTMPTSQYYDMKDRPAFTRNSLYQQSAAAAAALSKPQPISTKIKAPPSSIPIQQGQPFRLPQQPTTIPEKPVKKVEEKESLASLLQSLLDDVPTTTEAASVRYTPPPPASPPASPPAPMTTTEHIPVTAPLYLIIQGHSKVKTYGASKAPSMHSIAHNQLVGDSKSKVERFSRQV